MSWACEHGYYKTTCRTCHGQPTDPATAADRLAQARLTPAIETDNLQGSQTRQADTWLSREEIRQLLRDAVTVVQPGETLVVGVSTFYKPSAIRELQATAQSELDAMGAQVRVLVVPASTLGIAISDR
jgi:hypothetical protein